MIAAPAPRTVRVQVEDVQSGFRCGDAALDEFFARYASSNDERGIGRTYVLRRSEPPAAELPRVLGFYTLRIGETLLMDALARVLAAAETIGCFGVVVDAKNESAEAFYRKYDFHAAGTCDPNSGICSNPSISSPACNNFQPPVPTLVSDTTPGAPLQGVTQIDPSTSTITTMAADGAASSTPVAKTVTVASLAGATASCVADFNVDGNPDVLFVNTDGQFIKILPGLGPKGEAFDEAHIATVDTLGARLDPGALACDDVDGDGLIDVVTPFTVRAADGTVLPPQLVWYRNLGFGMSFERNTISTGFPGEVVLSAATLADLNSDGVNDLVVYAANDLPTLDSQMFVFPNSRNVVPYSQNTRVSVPQTAALATPDAAPWGAVTTFDWDGDGRRDVWALGNRGALFLFRAQNGFTFADPEFDGIVPDLGLGFTIGTIDANHDGKPDLLLGRIGRPPLPTPPRIHLISGGGVLATTPPKTFNGAGLLDPTKEPPFHPPLGTPTEEVGLVKGNTVASTWRDDRGIERESVFVVGVNGHLLERVHHSPTLNSVFQFRVQQAIQLSRPRDSLCLPTFCDSPNGLFVPNGARTETIPDIWKWVDHGVPASTVPMGPITLATGIPAIVLDKDGLKMARRIFLRGLDGHLWMLYQSEFTESWNDLGVPPPATAAHAKSISVGTIVPLVANPSAVVDYVNGNKVIKVFMLDAAGRLNMFRIDNDSEIWDQAGLGLIGAGNCVGRIGGLGEGSPKALHWFGSDFAHHVQVLVVGGMGDLFSWRDGVWEESLTTYRISVSLAGVQQPQGGYPNDLPLCPNSGQPVQGALGEEKLSARLDAVRGTPEAVAYDVGGKMTRSVYVRSAKQDRIVEYVFTGDVAPVAASFSNPPTVTWQTVDRLLNRRGQKPVTTTLTSPFCDWNDLRHAADVVSSDPRVVLDANGRRHLFFTANTRQLQIAHSPPPGSASLEYDWERQPVPQAAITGRAVINLASAFVSGDRGGPTKLDVFQVDTDGILNEATDVQPAAGQMWRNCAELCCVKKPNMTCPSTCQSGTTFAWADQSTHAPPNVPHVISQHEAIGRNLCQNKTVLDSIFPQWGPADSLLPDFDPHRRVTVEEAHSDSSLEAQREALREKLYPDPHFPFTGYEVELPTEIEGVVVGSHIAALDNPANHTPGAPGDVPRVHHDWNIVIAPDIKYQHMLTDANMISGDGTMELEWELADHLDNTDPNNPQRAVGTTGFTSNMVPAVGDRVAARGRYIFDCGHPPFHTEIHPIDALAVIRRDRVDVRFSSNGGTTWYQPSDVNLNDSTIPPSGLTPYRPMSRRMTRRFLFASVIVLGCGDGHTSTPKPLCTGELVTAGKPTTWLRAADGTMWEWGRELGLVPAAAPVVVQADWAFGLLDLQHEGNHACALSAAHEARCGNSPADLMLGAAWAADVASISVGIADDGELPALYQACAIKGNGAVWCGSSNMGKIDPAGVNEQTALGRDVSQLALQARQGCALKSDGTVWCWGRGYLGDGHAPYGEADPEQPPSKLTLPAEARTLASSTGATCVGLSDGTVQCFGQLDSMVLAPRPIEVTDVKELSAGERHFCALTNAGTVWCWGDNGHGQMGRRPASSFDVWIPAQIAGLTDVQSVTAGFRHTCAGHADGTVSCWGSNVDGQSDPVGWQSSVAMAIYDLTEPVVVRGCGE